MVDEVRGLALTVLAEAISGRFAFRELNRRVGDLSHSQHHAT